MTDEINNPRPKKKRIRITKQEDRATQLIDDLLKDYKTPEEILGATGLLGELTRRLVERATQGELTTHLGYEKHAVAGRNSGNSRNGSIAKTVQTQQGDQQVQIPRDRNGTFEPILLPKRERRLGNFDDQIISLYGRGLTQAQISEHLKESTGSICRLS